MAVSAIDVHVGLFPLNITLEPLWLVISLQLSTFLKTFNLELDTLPAHSKLLNI